MTLAQNSDPIVTIFGQVTPPGPSALHGDPVVGLAKLFAFGLNLIFLIAGITMLIYMLWGAFKWVSSGGDKESLEKARARMIHAFWGLIVMIAVLTIFGMISGNILGIIQRTPSGWDFKLPILQP